jgi:ArsR family transcriptional regulator, arsenate/arsenite/antimonite-responsive transcriptional repressor
MKRISDPDALLLQGEADPTRLAILRRLARAEELCACEFTDCCDVGQPTVSHHLKVLRESGWVLSERRGSWVWYRLRPDALERFGAISAELAPSLPVADRPLPVVQRRGLGPAQDGPAVSDRTSASAARSSSAPTMPSKLAKMSPAPSTTKR